MGRAVGLCLFESMVEIYCLHIYLDGCPVVTFTKDDKRKNIILMLF